MDAKIWSVPRALGPFVHDYTDMEIRTSNASGIWINLKDRIQWDLESMIKEKTC